MKKRWISLFLMMALVCGLITVPAAAGEPAWPQPEGVSHGEKAHKYGDSLTGTFVKFSAAEESPVVRDPSAKVRFSDSANRGGYKTYGRCVYSGLYQRADGNLTRMALWGIETIEVYDQNFQLLTTKEAPREKDFTLGGFFHGENYNFFVYGKQNLSQSDSQEVIRVVKYSKDWERLGQASLYGANTTKPFHFGSLRCAEYNGILYVRTCHEMYKSADGKNHQASMMLAVRQSDMEIIDSRTAVGGGGGYTSHSFNQFVIANPNGIMATLDHCDAYPRAAVLQRFDLNATGGKLDTCASVNLQEFPGKTGDNETFASIGGLAESSTHYLAVGNLGTSYNSPRDVYLYAVDKSSFTGYGEAPVKTVKLAAGAANVNTMSTPQLVKVSDDRFLVLWNVDSYQSKYDMYTRDGTLSYVFVDGSGNQIGSVRTVQKAFISDCDPVMIGGKAVWYSGAVLCSYDHDLTFYEIDGVTGAFTATLAKDASASR